MPSNNPEATVWKSNAERREGYDFRVPSGQLCRIRPMSIQTLVLNGIIDDVDAVTKLISADIMKKQGGKRSSNDKVREGLQFMASDDGRTAITLMDKIIPHVVLSPAVLPDPENDKDRDPEAIYVSDIDVNDRATIFAETMRGVEQVASFRD